MQTRCLEEKHEKERKLERKRNESGGLYGFFVCEELYQERSILQKMSRESLKKQTMRIDIATDYLFPKYEEKTLFEIVS